jgi:hypothetical protein
MSAQKLGWKSSLIRYPILARQVNTTQGFETTSEDK